jgi:osmotically-inducible protein OsmY
MESITLKAALAIGIACSIAGCNPAPSDSMARKPAGTAQTVPAKPAESFQSAVSPPKPAAAAPQTQNNALSEKVKSALTSTDEIKAGGLQVSANDGVVTLDGTVEVARDKQRAALIAMDVEGVRSVVNNLVVIKGSG